jgi:hypothetical protein
MKKKIKLISLGLISPMVIYWIIIGICKLGCLYYQSFSKVIVDSDYAIMATGIATGLNCFIWFVITVELIPTTN